jgi:hypothetical protein
MQQSRKNSGKPGDQNRNDMRHNDRSGKQSSQPMMEDDEMIESDFGSEDDLDLDENISRRSSATHREVSEDDITRSQNKRVSGSDSSRSAGKQPNASRDNQGGSPRATNQSMGTRGTGSNRGEDSED